MAYNPDYDGSDPTAPPPDPNRFVAGPEATNVSAIQQYYQQYLGRQASLADVNSWLNNPGGLAAIEQGIKSSPEAQAYAARNTTQTTPTTPPPTTPGTPPPAAATDYDFNQARANIERGLGRPITDAEIAAQFAKRGGNIQGRFNDATVAAVIADLKGSGAAPPPGPGGPGGPGTGTAGAPTYQGPNYEAPPAYVPPPAFSYEEFKGPDANAIFDDPGYQTRRDEGVQGLEHGAAARGVLNTGGTLKDVLRFGQDLASQEYSKMWDRQFQTYQSNRSNAFENYKTNYGISGDTYDRNYTTQYKDPFNFESQNAQGAYDSNIHNYDQNQFYQSHNADQNQFYKSHNTDLDRMYAWNQLIQDYNAGRNTKLDDFDQKYRILSLL